MKNEYRKRIILFVIWLLFAGMIAFRLFFRLGQGVVEITDEAWYGVNTYEMFQTGNWIVPTHHYEIDYGSKPPLQLWLILICNCIFGCGPFALRLPSAIAAFVTLIIVSLYLRHRYSDLTAVFFAASFFSLRQIFLLHGFRAGDMDALFCLLYAVAMISMAGVLRGRYRCLVLYGLTIGLAFLTKSMHAVMFVFAGVMLLVVRLVLARFTKAECPEKPDRKNLIRILAASAAAAVLPVAAWLAMRYPYDGFAYVRAIAFGETENKVNAGSGGIPEAALGYLGDIGREKITWLLLLVIAVRILLAVIVHFRTPAERRDRTGAALPGWFYRNSVALTGYMAPILFYVLAGSYMEWYIYPSYIGVCVLIAVIASECAGILRSGICAPDGTVADDRESSVTKRMYPWQATVFAVCILGLCALYGGKQLSECRFIGLGGNARDQFSHDLREYLEANGDINRGKRAYLALDRMRNYGDRGHWELDYIFYCDTITGFDCVDGGVEAFLEDEDSLLILDGELWDQYADVLTGHVFLELNTFYIMNHDWY